MTILSLGVERAIVVAMQTHEEHFVAVVKDILRPIPMVDVKIENQYFLSKVDGVLCCHRDIVEEAEAMEFILVGVVTRGSHDAIAAL